MTKTINVPQVDNKGNFALLCVKKDIKSQISPTIKNIELKNIITLRKVSNLITPKNNM
jgi:hypothetical protein